MAGENQVIATFCTLVCNIRIPCRNPHSNSFTAFNYMKIAVYENTTAAA